MTPYEKIRKALNTGDSCDLLTAMDALAELERAAAEPVARVYLSDQTDCLSVTYDDYSKLPAAGTPLYAAPPAPVVELIARPAKDLT